MTITFKHPTLGLATSLQPGCQIDGSHGQYGLAEMVVLADSLLGTRFRDAYPKADDGSLAGSIGPSGIWDIGNDHTEMCVAVADAAEAALNESTDGGRWHWYDGEFFLTDDDDRGGDDD